ncbi:GDP-mannose 4,6-dehydratase [Streptomyces sp. NPDC088725]|uniref:GDP-mannose 4,6-dehydratase n=1 Tax=Streptomyces sp. NPDC088725 TaxID=3365873 RepID=UPI0037FBF084
MPRSWQQAGLVTEVNGMGVQRVLEAIRMASGLSTPARRAPRGRFYQASSSEISGKAAETPQREITLFHPRSPYGTGQDVRSLHHPQLPRVVWHAAVSGTLCAHESPRRGQEFTTRKISLAVTRIKLGLQTGPRHHGRAPRPGLRGRLRPRHASDAPAGRGRRLRDRHRPDALGARRGPLRL